MSSSLLHDVLRPYGIDHLNRKLTQASLKSSNASDDDRDSEDEIVGVQSLPGTPSRSRAPSRPSSRPSSRASSPTKGAFKRPIPGPLILNKTNNADPLRIFPTELGQRIFGMLSISDLAKCARVCKKWSRSQTINYVWFQQHRKETFRDDKLPPGKWTRRESKQNWRQEYIKAVRARETELAHTPFSRSSTPSGSGYQTPRELREEQWKAENEMSARPGKLEMREMYKEMGGRKSRTKSKVGLTTGGTRDKGGWQLEFGDDYL
ncbi:hypothetical protein Clacol_008102 [Clathrus columnatus]|uniref:F-box domain-containing protein n=1 Tax=Clathrus columnatus TaxID=1419009 RepID=A0AAV5AHK4_9AGAM|nr:hypothetical protein Clacol_008102 [Clathrus columnatus]